jgi:hypothetical protein
MNAFANWPTIPKITQTNSIKSDAKCLSGVLVFDAPNPVMETIRAAGGYVIP